MEARSGFSSWVIYRFNEGITCRGDETILQRLARDNPECRTPSKRQKLEWRFESSNVYERSQKEGEQDLVDLARNVAAETSYLYYDGKWIPTAWASGGGWTKSSFEKAREHLLRDRPAKIYDYHTHPMQNLQWFCLSLARGEILPIDPSANDFVHSTVTSIEARSLGIKYESRLADATGIWSYQLQEGGEAHTILMTHGIPAFKEWNSHLLRTYFDIFYENTPRRERIEKYIKSGEKPRYPTDIRARYALFRKHRPPSSTGIVRKSDARE